MKWSNAQKDEMPHDGQVVLASVNGVYYIARYDSAGNLFRAREDPTAVFNADEYLIYWTPFADPEL
jgi:hypothetical protein